MPSPVFEGVKQYMTSATGTIFYYDKQYLSWWNGSLYTINIKAGYFEFEPSSLKDLKESLRMLIENNISFTAAAFLNAKLMLFFGQQFLFYDDVKTSQPNLKTTASFFKTVHSPYIRHVYFDMQTNAFYFFMQNSYYYIPASLVDADTGTLFTSVTALPLSNLFICSNAKKEAIISQGGKMAAIAVSSTLVFILLVACCVFNQISRRRGRGGLKGEIKRLRRNRLSTSNLQKWQKSSFNSQTSATGSRISSAVSRSQYSTSSTGSQSKA